MLEQSDYSPFHRPILSGFCPVCRHSFASVSPKAIHCSDRCRVIAWRGEKRRQTLVDMLMSFFELAASERPKVLAAVERFERAFLRFAKWLGYRYHTKKYCWQTIGRTS